MYLYFLIVEYYEISQNKIKAFSVHYGPWLEIFLFVKRIKWWYRRRHLLLYFLTLCWLRTTNSLILIEGGNFFYVLPSTWLCKITPWKLSSYFLQNMQHLSSRGNKHQLNLQHFAILLFHILRRILVTYIYM